MTLGPTVKDKQTGRSRFQSQLHNPVFSSPPRRPFANRSDSLSPSRSGRKTHNASRPGSSAATSRVSCSRRRPHNSRLCCSCSESPFVSNLSEVPAPPPGTWRRSHVRERQPFNIPATCASSSSRWCVFRVNAGESFLLFISPSSVLKEEQLIGYFVLLLLGDGGMVFHRSHLTATFAFHLATPTFSKSTCNQRDVLILQPLPAALQRLLLFLHFSPLFLPHFKPAAAASRLHSKELLWSTRKW